MLSALHRHGLKDPARPPTFSLSVLFPFRLFTSLARLPSQFIAGSRCEVLNSAVLVKPHFLLACTCFVLDGRSY